MALNKVKSRQNLLLGFSVFIFLALAIIFEINSEKPQDLPEEIIKFSIKNFDGEIKIDWKVLIDKKKFDSVEVALNGEGVSETKNFSTEDGSYSFLGGKHGKGYDIMFTVKKGNEVLGRNFTRALFLEYNKLPDFPILLINTKNGQLPKYKIAQKEKEWFLGTTYTDAEVLDCEIIMLNHGKKIADSRGKIRVRGNTTITGIYKPYKLKLDNAADLLELGSEHAEKEWALLNIGDNINTYFVTELANLCNVEWQPQIRYVNLVINNDWIGCYILSETVKRGSNRVNISKSGYIFEMNPYFWRPGTKFFRTSNTDRHFGFTFKYPTGKALSNEKMNQLKIYLQKIENDLKSENVAYNDYLDAESFATWALVHDLSGNVDGAGSNVFFYKYDFNLENPNSSKIKMGPLWDFNNSFRVENNWSNSHYAVYLDQLFKIESFQQIYKDKFYSVKDRIIPALTENFNKINKNHWKAFQESWDLHSERWRFPYKKLEDDIQFRLKFLENQINWLDKKLQANDWN